MRRGAPVDTEEQKRRAALSSKSFRNRLARGVPTKSDLFVKAGDMPDAQENLPDIGSDRTQAARDRLETADQLTKRRTRKERREDRRKARNSTGVFSKRATSRLDEVEAVPEGEQTTESGTTGGDENDEELEQQASAAVVEEELDILRTARISKRGVELEITHAYPDVKLTPFGNNWATDSFALIHNAIKAELRDMFRMANVMQKRKMLLTLKHIDVFYEWWSDFKEFVTTALDIEEEVYFPWVGSKDYVRGAFKKSERMKVNGATRKTIENITEYKDKFLPYLPVGERLEGLLVLLDGFNALLKHYDAVTSSLPQYLETLFKQKEKEANGKEIVAAFRATDGYNRNLVLLARWMPDRAIRRWAVANMRTKDWLSFRSWRTVIQREHCALASKFEDIVMEEEEEALGAPVIGAAMAINEEMREHIDNNRVSVRSLPKSAFT